MSEASTATSRPSPRNTRSLWHMRPQHLAAALAILALLNGVVLAWRYASYQNAAPRTYEDFQIRRWQQQLLTHPKDPAVWATLGGLYEQKGDYAKAKKAFARALAFDPASPPALMFKARQARKERRFDEAHALLDKALKALPTGSRALVYYEIGEVERERGDRVAAIKMYEASVKDNGTYFNAYQRLAFLYVEVGDKNKALWAADRAEVLSGGAAQDVSVLAKSLRSQGATYTEESIGN